MSYQTDREEFIAQWVLERARLHLTVGAAGARCEAQRILRNANTVQRYAVAACNRMLTEAEQRRESAACRRIEKDAAPFKVTTSGDPRGCCVKIHFPSGAYNTWGGPESGWGVPTRER